jgi:cAMP-dependent protein kinase regulator
MGCNNSSAAYTKQDSAQSMSEEDRLAEEEEKRKISSMSSKKRGSISAAAVSEDDIRNYVPPSYPKPDASKDKIAQTMKGNDKMKVLGMEKLNGAQLNDMVMAFQERRVKQNEDVIIQGQPGDALYVIESGSFDIFVSRTLDDGKLGAPVKVANFGPGSLFGELAILYNSPRAATVRCASTEGLLWSLEREPFQMLLKKCGIEKVEQYSGWLTQVDILKVLNLHEISQLADACESVLLEKDEIVIKQGDAGDAFFILEEGECAAFIEASGGEKMVKKYESQGDYFGELALINNAPRKATVRALGDAVVLKVEKESFDNLMGPIIDRLRGNASKYPQYADVINSS